MVDVIIPSLRLSQKTEDQWREAAFHWRLPFWDWAKNPQIPKLMGSRRIQIRFPKVIIDNPLYKFKMPKGEKMGVYGVGTLKSPDFEDTLEVTTCSRGSSISISCPDQLTSRCSHQVRGVLRNQPLPGAKGAHEHQSEMEGWCGQH